MTAANSLHEYLQGLTTKDQFTALCEGCSEATQHLLDSLNGQIDCDALQLLNEGYIQGGYFAGWADEINSKGGYILTLANLGITVQSAYVAFNGGNYTDVDWLFVQTFKEADSRMLVYSKEAIYQYDFYANLNLPRMVEATTGLGEDLIKLTTEAVLGLISRWFPYRWWMSQVTNNVVPGQDYWYICYNCIGLNGVTQEGNLEGLNYLEASYSW